MPEAQVVCRQLQFPAAKSVVTAEVYRSGGFFYLLIISQAQQRAVLLI